MTVNDGLPTALITYCGETLYEYADGSIRRDAGSGMWKKLTKTERAMVANLPRLVQSADTSKLDDTLHATIALLHADDKVTVSAGPTTPTGFRVSHADSMYSVLVEVTDPEGSLTLHLQHTPRYNLECGSAALTGSVIERTTLAGLISTMLSSGMLS